MRRTLCACVVLAMLTVPAAVAQIKLVTGDRTTPLQPLAGEGNVGVSNATLRNQDEVRVLRVMVEPGGRRVMHSHDDVQYHLFVPISAPMQLELGTGEVAEVSPWHPYFMRRGTQHSFHNPGADPVEIIEIFVR
jgi:mannose-6-phosphate isomerase-like protein (cupin superfamily)